MTFVIEYEPGATPIDLDEAAGLKHKHVTTMAQLNELEQANIETGLLWLSRMRRKDILSDDFVTDLHWRLFGDVWTWAGKYRTTEKSIGIDPFQISVQVRELMGTADYWWRNDTYAPSVAAVTLHHRLVKIHPFANGNGRHARIMADTVLKKVYGAEPIDWTAGHDLQKLGERRRAYIKALQAADGENYGPLLAFIGPRPDLPGS